MAQDIAYQSAGRRSAVPVSEAWPLPVAGGAPPKAGGQDE